MGVAPACARVAAGTYSRKYRRVNVQRAAETSASSDRRAAISNITYPTPTEEADGNGYGAITGRSGPLGRRLE
jgi:hypothetical protein